MKRCPTCGWFWSPRPAHWWNLVGWAHYWLRCPYLDFDYDGWLEK